MRKREGVKRVNKKAEDGRMLTEMKVYWDQQYNTTCRITSLKNEK